MPMREKTEVWLRSLQDKICNGIESLDGGKFREDKWERPGGGGGVTRIISNGNYIEKGGVNFSAVHGKIPEFLKNSTAVKNEGGEFFATGVSIVLHPRNPEVPIIHMNVRYFEMENDSWFGGGIDLTPHYVNDEDAGFFHRSLKKMCDRFDAGYYEEFKLQADDYFFIRHRNETRGIGGIFFDHLRAENDISINSRFDFIKATGEMFLPVYTELLERNKTKKFSENELRWQNLRRGRYVEFNLVYDRGTKFGLETDGRVESILMSLPLIASWEYDFKPEKGSREEYTQAMLKKGLDWK